MKKIVLALVLAAAFTAGSVHAQVRMPQPSSSQTIVQEFGLGKITLAYSRPNMKGRAIFGGLEPYGTVWRAGANTATTLEFTNPVTIQGQAVAPGTYALFLIPEKTGPWTLILNKNAKQWGAYTYKESDDLLRVKVSPLKTKEKTETFTMQFANVKAGSCELHILWEDIALPVKLTTDYDAIVMADLDKAMAGDKKPYFQAATYYLENGKDIQKALEWVDEADKQSPNQTYVKYWKAKIQLKAGDKAGAALTAQQGVDLAKAQKMDEYVRLNGQVLALAKK